jgi:hypothetical protein
MNGPIAALVAPSRSNSPNAAPCSSAGAVSRMSDAELVEISAPLTAWPTRDASSSSKVVASEPRADAMAKPNTPTRKARRCPNRSPIEPPIGRATATAPR